MAFAGAEPAGAEGFQLFIDERTAFIGIKLREDFCWLPKPISIVAAPVPSSWTTRVSQSPFLQPPLKYGRISDSKHRGCVTMSTRRLNSLTSLVEAMNLPSRLKLIQQCRSQILAVRFQPAQSDRFALGHRRQLTHILRLLLRHDGVLHQKVIALIQNLYETLLTEDQGKARISSRAKGSTS